MGRVWGTPVPREPGAESAVRPHGVIVLPPPFAQDMGLSLGVEDFPIEELISELSVKGLAVAVLPGTSGFDEQGAHLKPGEPLAHALRTELGAIVGAQVIRTAPGNKQVGQCCQHIIRRQFPGRHDREGLSRELIHDREQPEHLPVVRPIGQEVVRPDMVRVLGAEAHARPVGQPEPAALGLALRHLQAYQTPEPRHSLPVHPPAVRP